MLDEVGFRANLLKCEFFVEEVCFLDHVLSREGIRPNPEKVKAIQAARPPHDKTSLQYFFGLIGYCSKFMKGLNTQLAPLFDLLREGESFEWTPERDMIFQECKRQISEDALLAPFDPAKELCLTVYANDKGLGGVLCHEIKGKLYPLKFLSRRLTPAEENYPILHREALALVWSIEKCHEYLFGRPFKVFTDHEPLVGVFRSTDLAVVAKRLQKYVLQTLPYDFSVSYLQGKKNVLAVFCSRFLVGEAGPTDVKEEAEVNSLQSRAELTLDLQRIAQETEKDQLLSDLGEVLLRGTDQGKIPDRLRIFRPYWSGLSMEKGVIVFCGRILIPKASQGAVLALMHRPHLGVVRTKCLARGYVFWVGMNKDIEKIVRECETCQMTRPPAARFRTLETSHHTHGEISHRRDTSISWITKARSFWFW